MDAIIRDPKEPDLSALVDIYNHYVTSSHVTFDVEPKTIGERRGWFEAFSPATPHRLLVAESEGRIVGYACSTQFRPKHAYRTSVETTIYLDPGFTRRGIGVKLYGGLLESLQNHRAVHQAYAGVALPNPGSVALHERLGFEFVGTFREVGFKFGRYWSVSWYQKPC